MKTRTSVSILSIMALTAILMMGCKLSTTVVVEEEYDVRLVNRSGDRVKVRWGDGSYYYVDHGSIISIPADGGYYELEWVGGSSSRHTRPTKIFKIEIEMDIDIVFHDDPDIVIIER
ncbi:hypothetical protein ACFL6S_31745 [Candidatus Poribacteria bacterium]